MKSNKTEVKKEEKSCHKFAVSKKKTKKTYKRSEKKIRLWRIFFASKGTQNNSTFFLNDTLIIYKLLLRAL